MNIHTRTTQNISHTEFAGRTGIIACLNFYNGGSGDHIDLWNKSTMSGNQDHHDYISRSPQVWFWDVS